MCSFYKYCSLAFQDTNALPEAFKRYWKMLFVYSGRLGRFQQRKGTFFPHCLCWTGGHRKEVARPGERGRCAFVERLGVLRNAWGNELVTGGNWLHARSYVTRRKGKIWEQSAGFTQKADLLGVLNCKTMTFYGIVGNGCCVAEGVPG